MSFTETCQRIVRDPLRRTGPEEPRPLQAALRAAGLRAVFAPGLSLAGAGAAAGLRRGPRCPAHPLPPCPPSPGCRSGWGASMLAAALCRRAG